MSNDLNRSAVGLVASLICPQQLAHVNKNPAFPLWLIPMWGIVTNFPPSHMFPSLIGLLPLSHNLRNLTIHSISFYTISSSKRSIRPLSLPLSADYRALFVNLSTTNFCSPAAYDLFASQLGLYVMQFDIIIIMTV